MLDTYSAVRRPVLVSRQPEYSDEASSASSLVALMSLSLNDACQRVSDPNDPSRQAGQ